MRWLLRAVTGFSKGLRRLYFIQCHHKTPEERPFSSAEACARSTLKPEDVALILQNSLRVYSHHVSPCYFDIIPASNYIDLQ